MGWIVSCDSTATPSVFAPVGEWHVTARPLAELQQVLAAVLCTRVFSSAKKEVPLIRSCIIDCSQQFYDALYRLRLVLHRLRLMSYDVARESQALGMYRESAIADLTGLA